MRDAVVERMADQFTAIVEVRIVTEIMPQAERYGGQFETTVTTAAVLH